MFKHPLTFSLLNRKIVTLLHKLPRALSPALQRHPVVFQPERSLLRHSHNNIVFLLYCQHLLNGPKVIKRSKIWKMNYMTQIWPKNPTESNKGKFPHELNGWFVHLEETAPCFSNDLSLEELVFVSRRSTLIIPAVKVRWAFKRQIKK